MAVSLNICMSQKIFYWKCIEVSRKFSIEIYKYSIPAGQVDQMHLRNRLGRHIPFGEAGLHEGYCEYSVTPTADVVHICARRRSVRVSSYHAFLQNLH